MYLCALLLFGVPCWDCKFYGPAAACAVCFASLLALFAAVPSFLGACSFLLGMRGWPAWLAFAVPLLTFACTVCPASLSALLAAVPAFLGACSFLLGVHGWFELLAFAVPLLTCALLVRLSWGRVFSSRAFGRAARSRFCLLLCCCALMLVCHDVRLRTLWTEKSSAVEAIANVLTVHFDTDGISVSDFNRSFRGPFFAVSTGHFAKNVTARSAPHRRIGEAKNPGPGLGRVDPPLEPGTLPVFTDGSGGTDGPGRAAGPALRASSQAGWGVYVDTRANSAEPRRGFEMCGPVDTELPSKNRNGLAEISAVARAVLYVRAHLVKLGDTFVLEEGGARVTPPF